MTPEELLALARRTPNRGRCHVFVGHPLSDTCDKTTVEPGNVFSPGVWTCGVSVWVVVEGRAYAAELLEEAQVEWHFGEGEDGLPPVLAGAWSAGPVSVRSCLVQRGGPGAEGCDFLSVELRAETPRRATVAVVVKEVGPAGGHISSIAEADGGLRTNSGLRVRVLNRPCRAVIDGAAGLLCWEVNLPAGAAVRLDVQAEHGFEDRPFGASVPRTRPFAAESAEQAFERAREDWARALPARVFAPDPRVAAVWERSAFHVLAAMECGLPRISAVNYPIFWMRDCVLVLRALDLIGRPRLARTGCDYLAPLTFSGGFGAESDAPGQAIWALTQHARMSADVAWLREVYPHVARRARLLMQMRRTTEVMRAMTENRHALAQTSPASTVLCLPAQNGLIHGRMDWHSPDFFINCWAVSGMRAAAGAAERLGLEKDAAEFGAEAQEWSAALVEHLLPAYGNERDPAITPHPSGAIGAENEELSRRFGAWFGANRLDAEGRRRREPLWTYFEAAQIHNALLLGMAQEAWVCLDGMLEDASRPLGVAAWTEGQPGGGEYLPYRNDPGARGWLDRQHAYGGNMPHNWTSAEMLCCLRSVFVREEGEGLALGLGVPGSWLKPGSRFGVRRVPTERGPVSYTVTVDAAGAPQLEYDGPPGARLAVNQG
jgi:hypothetical protein